MKIDQAINMLQEAKANGSKNIIFAFWEAGLFERKAGKTFKDNETWANITNFIDENMDWAYVHESLQEIISENYVKD